MNLQPQHLQNEWIQLVPLQVTDFEALYAVAADPLLWEQHPNKLRYKQEVFQNYFDGAILSEGAFLILEAKSKEVIGSSRFYDFNKKDFSPKIMISPYPYKKERIEKEIIPLKETYI